IENHRITWSEKPTGLVVLLDIKRYPDFPVVEWLLRFKNGGTQNTPILENIRSMNLRFRMQSIFVRSSRPLFHYHDGDTWSTESYQPHCRVLKSGSKYTFAPVDG